MTDKLLLQAQEAQKNIMNINKILNAIQRIKVVDNQQKKPFIRFANILKWKDGKEVKEAAIILFDGINTYGTDVPVDAGLLDCIKEYYEKKLEETQAEFEAL